MSTDERKLDSIKKLADKKVELSAKTGVVNVTPASGRRDVDSQLETVEALLDAKGTELNDLMQRPRETARARSEREFAAREERKQFRRRSVRMRKAIPKG